ncbi:MAG: ThiF family adenylyltransferase [Bdellovibrionales bacterium]|nr:ThiF family adenylyltransferase [Bdellovibrionales bacterium]
MEALKLKYSLNYQQSFSRNIGVITSDEQTKLKNAHIAIAGLGGIGGMTFLTLVRMGVENFSIADLDTFEIANLNRQVGSNHANFGRTKVDVMKEEAFKINPDVKIKVFPIGINEKNVDEFVCESDLVIDAIEYFSITAREILQLAAKKHKKPTLFSAPLGFSATFLAFSKDSMPFDEYFNLKPNLDPAEKVIHFTVGIAPKGLHRSYMNFNKEQLIQIQTGPSLALAVNLGSSLLCAEALKFITGKKSVKVAPYYTQLDLFQGKFVQKKMPWGNHNPLQKLKIYLAKKEYFTCKQDFLKFIK